MRGLSSHAARMTNLADPVRHSRGAEDSDSEEGCRTALVVRAMFVQPHSGLSTSFARAIVVTPLAIFGPGRARRGGQQIGVVVSRIALVRGERFPFQLRAASPPAAFAPNASGFSTPSMSPSVRAAALHFKAVNF